MKKGEQIIQISATKDYDKHEILFMLSNLGNVYCKSWDVSNNRWIVTIFFDTENEEDVSI